MQATRRARTTNVFFSSLSYAFSRLSSPILFIYLFIFFLHFIFLCFSFFVLHTPRVTRVLVKATFFLLPREAFVYLFFFYHFFFFLFFNIFVKQDCKTVYYCNCIMAMIVRRFGSADANCPHLNISRYISRQLTV